MQNGQIGLLRPLIRDLGLEPIWIYQTVSKRSWSENPYDFLSQYFVNSPHTRRSTLGAVLEGRYTSQVLYGGRVRVSRILELRDYDIYAICQRYKPRLALPAPSV